MRSRLAALTMCLFCTPLWAAEDVVGPLGDISKWQITGVSATRAEQFRNALMRDPATLAATASTSPRAGLEDFIREQLENALLASGQFKDYRVAVAAENNTLAIVINEGVTQHLNRLIVETPGLEADTPPQFEVRQTIQTYLTARRPADLFSVERSLDGAPKWKLRLTPDRMARRPLFRKGEPADFSRIQLVRWREHTQDALAHIGYLNPRVNVEVNAKGNLVDLRLTIEQLGPSARIDEVRILGAQQHDRDSLAGTLRWKKDAPFTFNALLKHLRQLHDSGRFNNLSLNVSAFDNGTADLTLTVEEVANVPPCYALLTPEYEALRRAHRWFTDRMEAGDTLAIANTTRKAENRFSLRDGWTTTLAPLDSNLRGRMHLGPTNFSFTTDWCEPITHTRSPQFHVLPFFQINDRNVSGAFLTNTISDDDRRVGMYVPLSSFFAIAAVDEGTMKIADERLVCESKSGRFVCEVATGRILEWTATSKVSGDKLVWTLKPAATSQPATAPATQPIEPFGKLGTRFLAGFGSFFFVQAFQTDSRHLPATASAFQTILGDATPPAFESFFAHHTAREQPLPRIPWRTDKTPGREPTMIEQIPMHLRSGFAHGTWPETFGRVLILTTSRDNQRAAREVQRLLDDPQPGPLGYVALATIVVGADNFDQRLRLQAQQRFNEKDFARDVAALVDGDGSSQKLLRAWLLNCSKLTDPQLDAMGALFGEPTKKFLFATRFLKPDDSPERIASILWPTVSELLKPAIQGE